MFPFTLGTLGITLLKHMLFSIIQTFETSLDFLQDFRRRVRGKAYVPVRRERSFCKKAKLQ